MEVYPDFSIIYQFCQLLVLLIVLHFLVFKPVLKAFAKRNQTMQSLTEKADDSRHTMEGLGKAYEDTLRDKKAPILEEKDHILKTAHGSSIGLIEEARRDLAVELAKVKDSVKAEADKAFEVLSGRSDALAGEIVNKIVKRST
jgi:F-type H+-transporting ATPase subunit b